MNIENLPNLLWKIVKLNIEKAEKVLLFVYLTQSHDLPIFQMLPSISLFTYICLQGGQ